MKILENDVVMAVWFVGSHDVDWLAIAVTRGDNIVCEYRFRYYAEDGPFDPFDSRDRKSVYSFQGKVSEWAHIQTTIDQVQVLVVSQMNATLIDKFEVNGTARDLIAQLATKSWAHTEFK